MLLLMTVRAFGLAPLTVYEVNTQAQLQIEGIEWVPVNIFI